VSPAATPDLTDGLDPRLLEEAADWAITLRYDDPDEALLQLFDRWRCQSAGHSAAWERAQEMFRQPDPVAAVIGKAVLRRDGPSTSRRMLLRGLVLTGLVAPAGALALRKQPWRSWFADLRTGVGERRALTLPDSTELALNTATAVNLTFSGAERRLRILEGEILVSTVPDPAARPFLVETQEGEVQTAGARFGLRCLADARIRVSVFEHSVGVVTARGGGATLQAGEQAEFTGVGIGETRSVEDGAALWRQGMLLAQDMRLAEVIDELSRYRHGLLRCDPAVAGLRVSGALSLTDIDSALELLAQTLPVQVVRRSDLWVTVTARS
jgi:transmembrane sensor